MNNRNSSNFNVNSYFEIANSPHQQSWDHKIPENVTNTGANESYPTLTPAISQQIAPDFMNWRQNSGAGREKTLHYHQTEVASTSPMNIQSSSPNPLLPKSQQKPKLNSKLYQEALARKSELGLDSHRSTALEALRSYSPESHSPPPSTTAKKFDMFSTISALTEYQDQAQPSVESFQSKQASYIEDIARPLRSILKKYVDGDSPSTSREGLLSPAPQPPAFENIDDEDKYLYGDSPEEGKTSVVEPQNDSYSKWNKSKVSTVQGNMQFGVRDNNDLQINKDNTRSYVGSAATPNVAPAIPMNIKHHELGNSSSSVQNKSQDEVIVIPPEESSSNKETVPRAPTKKHYRKNSVNSRVDDIERHVLRYSGKYYDSGNRRFNKTKLLKTTQQTVGSDPKSRVPPIPVKKKTLSKPVIYMVHNETATTKAAHSLKSGVDAKEDRENLKTVPSTFVPLAVRKPAVISKPDKVFKEAEEKLSQKNKTVGNEDIFVEEEPDTDPPASSAAGKNSISKRDTLIQKKQDAFAKAIAQPKPKSNPKIIKKSAANSSSQPKAPEMDRVVRFVKNNKPVPEPKVTLIVKDPYKKRSPSPRRPKKKPYKYSDNYVPPRSRTAEYEKSKYFPEALRSRSRHAYDSTYTHRTRDFSRSPDRSPYERLPRSPKYGRSERKLHPYSRSPERYYDPRSPYHKEKGSYRYYEKSPVRLSRSRSRSPARYSEELSPDRWSEKSCSKEYIGSPRYRSYSPLETSSRYGKRRRSYDRSSSELSNERDGKGHSFDKLHSPISTPEVNSPFEDENSDSDNGEKSSRYSRRDKYEKAKRHARQLSPQVDRYVKSKKHAGQLNPQVRTTANESSVKTPLNKLAEKEVKLPDEGKAAVSNVERTESTFLNEDPSSSLQPSQVAPSATNDVSTGGSKTCEDFFEIITNLRNAGNTASTLLEPTSTYATVAQSACIPVMHPPNMPPNLHGFNQTQSSALPVYSQSLNYTDAAHVPMSQYSTMDNSFGGHPVSTYSQDFMQNYMQYSPYNVPQQQQPSHSAYYNLPPHYAQTLPQTYLPSPPIVSSEVLPPMPQLKSPKKYHRRIPSLKAIPMDPDVSKSSSMETKQSGPLDSLTESLMSETTPSYHKLKINLNSQVLKQKEREASHVKGNEKDEPSSIKSIKPKEDVGVRPTKEKAKTDAVPTKEKSQGGWSAVHEKAGHFKSFQEMKRERDIRKLEERKEELSSELKKANNHFAVLMKTKNKRTSKWDDKGINDEIEAANGKIAHILKEHQKTNNALKALIKSANLEAASSQKAVEVSKKPVKKIRYMDCDAYWCEHCNEVFHTSKDMLSHFHASDHFQLMDPEIRYWPDSSEEYNEPGVEYYDLPLKGIQYIVPVKGFYCSICKQCFPDQTITERHIKSKDHNEQYMKYSEEHPDLTQKYESRRLRAVNLNEYEQKKKRQLEILKASKKIRSSLNRTVMQEVDAQKAIIEANLKDDEVEASSGPTHPRKVVPQIIKFDFADKAKKKIIEEKKAEKQSSTPVVYIGKVTSLLSRSELSKNKKAKTVEKSAEDIVIDNLTKDLLSEPSLPENDSSVNAKKKTTPLPSSDSNKASPPVGTDKKNQQKDTKRKSTAVAAAVSQKKAVQAATSDQSGTQKDIASKEPASSDKNNSSSFFGPPLPPGFVPASKPKKMAKKKEDNAIQSATTTQEPKKNSETKAVVTPLKEIALPKDSGTSLPEKPALKLDEIMLPKDAPKPIPVIQRAETVKCTTEEKVPVTYVVPTPKPPLSEEEQDFILLGINKLDMQPLAIPKRPPFLLKLLHDSPAKPSESTKPPFPPTSLHVPPPSLHVPPPSLHIPPPPLGVQHPSLHIPPPSLHVPPPPIKFTPNVPMHQMPPRGTIRSLPFHHKPPISFIRPTPSVTTICPVSIPLLKLKDKEDEKKDTEEPKASGSIVANSNDFAETKGQDIPSQSKVDPISEIPQSNIIDEHCTINKEKVEENAEISLVSKSNISENNLKVACNETQKPSLDNSSVETDPLGTIKTPDTKSVLSDSVLPSKEEGCLTKDLQISIMDSQSTLDNQRTAKIDKRESTAPSKCDDSEIKGGIDNSGSMPDDSIMEVDSTCALQSQSANVSALVTGSVTKIHQEPLSLRNASCTETMQPNTLDSESAVDGDLVKPTSECIVASELIISRDVEETTAPSSENSKIVEEPGMVVKASMADILPMDVVEKVIEDRSIPEERQKYKSIKVKLEDTQDDRLIVEKVQKDISIDEKIHKYESVLEKIKVNEITSPNNAIPICQVIGADTMAKKCVLAEESKPEVQSDGVEVQDAKLSVDSVMVKSDESVQETKTLDANKGLQFAMDKTPECASLVVEVANQKIEKEMESRKNKSMEPLVVEDTTIKIRNHNIAPSQVPAENDATFSNTMQQKDVTCADIPSVPMKEKAKLEILPALEEQEVLHPKIQAAPIPCVASSSSNPLPTLNSEQMPAQGVYFETFVKQLLENKAVEPTYVSKMQRKDVSNSVQDLVDNIDNNLRNMKPQKKNENSVENARDILLDIVSQVGESTHDSLNWVLSPCPISEPLKGKKQVLPKGSKTMIRSRPTTRLSAKNALKGTDAKREPILVEKPEQAKEVDSGLSSLSTEGKCMEYENEQKDEVKQSNKGSEVDTAEGSPKCPILVAEIPSDGDSKHNAMKTNNGLQKADTLEKLASPIEIQQRKEDSPMPELIAVIPVTATDTVSIEIKALKNASKIPDLSQMEDCHSKDSDKGSNVLYTSQSIPLNPRSSELEITPMDTDDKALPCSELRPKTNHISCLPKNNFASETIPAGTSSPEIQLNNSVIPQKASISKEVSPTKRGTIACSKTQEEKEAESVEKCFSALEAYAKTRFPCDENDSSTSNSNSGEFGLPKTAPASANNTSALNLTKPNNSTHLAGTERNVTAGGIIPHSTNSPETSSSNNVFAGSSMSGMLRNTHEMDTPATGVSSAKDQEDSSSDDEVIFVAAVTPVVPETASHRVPETIDIESDDSCSETFPDLAYRIKKEKEESKEMRKKSVDIVTIEADECEDSNTQDKEAEEKNVVKPDFPDKVVSVKKEASSCCFDYGAKASSSVSKILENVEKSIKKEKCDDRKEKICVFKDFPFKTGVKLERNDGVLPMKGSAKVKKEKKAPGKKTNDADEDTDTDEYETIE